MSKFHCLTTFAIILLQHSLPSHSSPLSQDTSTGTSILPVANPPTCLFPGDPGRAPSSDCQSALSQFPNTTTSTHFHTALTPNKTNNDFILPLSRSHGTCNITIGLLPTTHYYATDSWRRLTRSVAGLIDGCQADFDNAGAYTTGGNTSVVVPTTMQASTSPDVSLVGWTVNVTAAAVDEAGRIGGGGRKPVGYGP